MEFTKGLATLGTPAAQIALRSALVYIAILVALRVSGKREIGQFTLFDLVLVLLVANSVQTAMVGADTSLFGGLLSAAVLVGLNSLVGLLASRVEWIHRLLVGEATQLIAGGKVLEANMKRESVDADDLAQALREHELEKPSEAAAAWLETDGTISIVPKAGRARHVRRHVRQVKHG